MRSSEANTIVVTTDRSVVDAFFVMASNFLWIKLRIGTNGSRCCTSARNCKRTSVTLYQRLTPISSRDQLQLFGLSEGLVSSCSGLPFLELRCASISGDCPLLGESAPAGRGVFTAIVISGSPSPSVASWYISGLVCRDLEGLIEGFKS